MCRQSLLRGDPLQRTQHGAIVRDASSVESSVFRALRAGCVAGRSGGELSGGARCLAAVVPPVLQKLFEFNVVLQQQATHLDSMIGMRTGMHTQHLQSPEFET